VATGHKVPFRPVCLGAAVALTFALAGSANAGAWSNDSGSNSAFSWSGGQNSQDHFGNPTVSDTGFRFNNTVGFRAEGGGGSGDSVSDIAQVLLTATSAPLSFFTVREWGTWSSDISDSSDFVVQASIAVQSFSPPGPAVQVDISGQTLVFDPDGTWYTQGTITAPGGGWFVGVFKVNNTIQVDGVAPAGSFIEKTGMQVTLPEPASIVLLLAGSGALCIRRAGIR